MHSLRNWIKLKWHSTKNLLSIKHPTSVVFKWSCKMFVVLRVFWVQYKVFFMVKKVTLVPAQLTSMLFICLTNVVQTTDQNMAYYSASWAPWRVITQHRCSIFTMKTTSPPQSNLQAFRLEWVSDPLKILGEESLSVVLFMVSESLWPSK